MKILLIGDYSGVHNELRNALKEKNINVKLISDGDGYKKFAADIIIKYNTKKNAGKLYNAYSIFSELIGTKGLITFFKKWKLLRIELQGYDIVQLINPVALSGFGSIVNLFLLWYLKNHNKKIFLCALGDDYYWVKDCLQKNLKHTVLNGVSFYNFYKQIYATKYVYGFLYKRLNNYAIQISTNIIPGLYDYQRVYEWSNKVTKLVPLPINCKNIKSPIKIQNNSRIKIFHGWQKGKELRKGNLIFDKIVKKLIDTIPDKIDYKIAQNLPYNEYIELLNSSHIAFDQCLSYDKGVNGLLYMAAGMVAITGLEEQALINFPFYNPGQKIGINGKDNENYLLDELLALINNPKIIETISKNAIEFVTNNHESKYVANIYLEIWDYYN